MRLSELTWPQAEKYFAAHDTVIIGVGSIECHGRHMPLGTDTIIPDFLLEQMEQRTDALICPTIPYGATEYLGDFPGTVNLGPELLYQVLSRVSSELYRHLPTKEAVEESQRSLIGVLLDSMERDPECGFLREQPGYPVLVEKYRRAAETAPEQADKAAR